VLYDLFTNGQPQSCPSVCYADGVALRGFVEFFKKVGQFFFGNSRSGIADGQDHAFTVVAQGNGNGAMRSELVCIVQQIDEYLMHFVRVGMDKARRVRQVGLEFYSGFGGKAPEGRCGGFGDDLAGVEKGVMPGRFA